MAASRAAVCGEGEGPGSVSASWDRAIVCVCMHLAHMHGLGNARRACRQWLLGRCVRLCLFILTNSASGESRVSV